MLADSAEVAIKEWELEEQTAKRLAIPEYDLPSPALYEARRTFVGACGMGMDLVQDPIQRLTVMSGSFFDSRALRIAVEARIADVLDSADPKEGMFLGDIADLHSTRPSMPMLHTHIQRGQGELLR